MLGQCWALLALRLTLLRNTWSTGKWLSYLVVGVLGLGALAVAAAASAGMFFLGMWGLRSDYPVLVLAMLDGLVAAFLFFWFWGLVLELQRSDIIDLRKMLFLPVPLRMVFGLNFLASLFSPALLFFLPCAVALVAGLRVNYGPRAWLGLPLAFAFFLMVAAWAYYARGMLAILMENKRRRRVVLTVLPLCFVLLSQAPSVISNAIRRSEGKEEAVAWLSGPTAERVLVYGNVAVPLGWLPYGVWSVLQGDSLPAAASFLGLAGLAGLGLGLGYRATIRHYTGVTAERGKAGGPGAAAASERQVRPALTGRRTPWLDEDTGALTAACFLSYLRHPNIRILLIMPMCMGLFLLFMYRSGAYGGRLGGEGAWMPVIVLVWPFFNFSFVLFNIFGIDRNGFRGLVLFPTPRHKYLLAKNLAMFPFVAGLSLAFVMVAALLLRTESRLVLISCVQVLQLYLMYCLIGNVMSLYFPYGIGRDAMRVRSHRALVLALGMVSAALAGILLIPTTFPMLLDDLVAAWWGYRGWPIGLTVSAALLALTGLAYRISLRHTGDVLMAREQRILGALLEEDE